MSFLSINQSETSGIKKSFQLNKNTITHFYQNYEKNDECVTVHLNHNMLVGHSNEAIPRTFTLCAKDNFSAIYNLDKTILGLYKYTE